MLFTDVFVGTCQEHTASQLLPGEEEGTNEFPSFDTTYMLCLFFLSPTLSELDDSSSALCYTRIKQRNSREDEQLLQVVFEG